MSLYILRVGETLAETLEHAIGAAAPQFAGYCANLEFWISEYEHLQTISDGFDLRLQAMKSAWKRYQEQTATLVSCDDCSEPYQSVKATSTNGDRQRQLARVRAALKNILRRAESLDIVGLETLDDFSKRLSRT